MQPTDTSLVIDGCTFAEADFPGIPEAVSQAGVHAGVFTVHHPGGGFSGTVESIGRLYRQLEAPELKCGVARSIQELVSNHNRERFSLILAFQDPQPIAASLDRLHCFYTLGLRVVQLTYNKANSIGCGCTESRDGGLTDFGRALIEEMNRLGMVIDLSHTSRQTALEALKLSSQPLIFSHANCRSLSPNPRNRSDEELKLVAERGGVIGLSPWGPICWKAREAEQPSLEDYLDHVDYAVALAGIDHVGFGSDNTLDGSPDRGGSRLQALLYPEVVAAYDRRVGGDASVRYARGFGGLAQLPAVTAGLRGRGYTSTDIDKFLGGNFYRVFKQIWRRN
jgi:membrane dipeptidase